ncbi:MAG: hypothetical protein R3B81_03265 [bacterium]
MALRSLQERPVAGGERFSAVIGPAAIGTRITRWLLAGCLAATLAAVLSANCGLPFAGLVGFAAGLLVGSVAIAALSGGEELLVCEGRTLAHRRAGPRIVERSVPLSELRDIRPHSDGVGGARLRLVTSRGTWSVAPRLPRHDVEALAAALRRHVDFADPSANATVPAAREGGRPARVTPSEALRYRHARR